MTSLTATRVRARTHTHISSRSLALCGAVLILVTAEGLATRDSAGSNQRKPDFFFFSLQRNRLPLVSNSVLQNKKEKKPTLFQKYADYHNLKWWLHTA